MKVCLISPPTVSEFNQRLVAESEALRLISQHAPLGILSLAAILDGQGIQTEIVDLNRLYYQYAGSDERCGDGTTFCNYVTKALASSAAEVFGLSTICSSYPLSLRLARGIRATHPDATIMLGGPQSAVVDVATMKAFPFVDFIVRGEAEESLPRLLDAISTNSVGLEKL